MRFPELLTAVDQGRADFAWLLELLVAQGVIEGPDADVAKEMINEYSGTYETTPKARLSASFPTSTAD
jgi:hypothetical protein